MFTEQRGHGLSSYGRLKVDFCVAERSFFKVHRGLSIPKCLLVLVLAILDSGATLILRSSSLFLVLSVCTACVRPVRDTRLCQVFAGISERGKKHDSTGSTISMTKSGF